MRQTAINRAFRASDVCIREAIDHPTTLEARLKTFQNGIVSAAQIMSRNFIDPVILNTPKRRREIQTMLADRIPTWVDEAPKTAEAPLVDLVEYALPL